MSMLQSMLPAVVSGGYGLDYQGTWNATTNSPALASGVGVGGQYYIVSVAGTTNLDGITDWQIGDMAIFSGTVWQKIDNSDTEAVWGQISGTLSDQTDLQTALDAKVPTSRTINGEALTGDVTLTQDDVGDGVTYVQYSATEKTKLAGIEAGADVTDAANVNPVESDPIVGAVNGIVKSDGAGNIAAAVADTDYQSVLAEGAFADGDKTKLDGIEAGADVTDAANVAAAGGLIDTNNLSDLNDAATARSNLGLGGLATLSSVDTGQITDDAVTQAKLASAVDPLGKKTMWLSADSMIPAATNGPAAGSTEEGNGINFNTLEFDPTADEFAIFNVAFPKSWNLGAVTYQVFWTTDGTSGNVVWGLQGVAVSNDDALNASFGSAVTVTDGATGTADDLHVSSESSDVTIGGTPADDDLIFFRFYRDADNAADTLASDAKLLGIKLFIDVDAANDE